MKSKPTIEEAMRHTGLSEEELTRQFLIQLIERVQPHYPANAHKVSVHFVLM
jgi:hypothetical protein